MGRIAHEDPCELFFATAGIMERSRLQMRESIPAASIPHSCHINACLIERLFSNRPSSCFCGKNSLCGLENPHAGTCDQFHLGPVGAVRASFCQKVKRDPGFRKVKLGAPSLALSFSHTQNSAIFAPESFPLYGESFPLKPEPKQKIRLQQLGNPAQPKNPPIHNKLTKQKI